LTDFWDAYRNRVLSGTTAADAACMIHQKVASTGVMLPAITRPAHYLGHMSTLTADFVNHVERLIETPVESSAMLLRSVAFLRETCRHMRYDITCVADPLERLLTMLEDVIEDEETVEREDADIEASPETVAAAANARAAAEQDEEEIEREALFPNRDRLEEALRVRLRANDFSESVIVETSRAIGSVYLECVQFARELERLSNTADEDTSAVMSVLMDMQYGLDSQLRGLLMEDIDTSDFEPTYRLGFFVWTAHLVAELMEKMQNARMPMALGG